MLFLHIQRLNGTGTALRPVNAWWLGDSNATSATTRPGKWPWCRPSDSSFLSIADHLILHFFRVQVKGAVGDVADKASDVSKGALGDTPKPKGGLFGRINEEALTKNSPSKQIGK